MSKGKRRVGSPVIVAVFNHKGGVAKTTTACNLSVCLAAAGYRVVLVDLDMQGNATNSFGISPLPPHGAYDVLTGRVELDDALLDTPYERLKLLPATTQMRQAELLASAERSHAFLRDRLAQGRLGAQCEVAVIDCPPSLGTVTVNALAAATAVLMPVRPDPFAHEGLVNTWYEVKRLRNDINPNLGVAGIVLTMTNAEPAWADVATAIRAEFGEQVYPCEIPTDPRVAEAAQLALPVSVLDPDGVAGLAYVEVTDELRRRLARQNRPDTRLRAAGDHQDVLNCLRGWRSDRHGALLRRPAEQKSGWAEDDGGGNGDEDDDWVPDWQDGWGRPAAAEDPRPVRKPRRQRADFKRLLRPAGLILAGLAAGMAVEAVTGLLAGWLN
jgi:chromosome partitioning protein